MMTLTCDVFEALRDKVIKAAKDPKKHRKTVLRKHAPKLVMRTARYRRKKEQRP